MKKVDITPEAYDDLEGLKERLDESFGVKKEKEILKAIFKDMKRLARYPQTDIKLFERFGIVTIINACTCIRIMSFTGLRMST